MSTNISWTDETWNPVTGCSKVSSGCKNCYAAALAPRLAAMGAKGYTNLDWTAANSDRNVILHPERLAQPLKQVKTSKRFFTASMSDLFHTRVPEDFLDRVFAVMALASGHTFQVLTKRAERMRDYLSSLVRHGLVDQAAFEISRDELGTDPDARNWSTIEWPLTNVWLGVSVEDQHAAEERIPHLLGTPAAIRFLSCEPLLAAVDLTSIAHTCAYSGEAMTFNALSEDVDEGLYFEDHPGGYDEQTNTVLCPQVHWVIAGGESGPNFREMNPQWARHLREDCRRTGTAFFFKQHSATRPEADIHLDGEVIRQFPGKDL